MTDETCHRRGCTEPAVFLVTEQYEEETGKGTVTAEAALCFDHTTEEHPHNLDQAGPAYRFVVEPLPDAEGDQ